MQNDQQRNAALDYHAKPTPGKIAVVPTKSYRTQRDLALAYSPGVAIPCLEIQKQVSDVYIFQQRQIDAFVSIASQSIMLCSGNHNVRQARWHGYVACNVK